MNSIAIIPGVIALFFIWWNLWVSTKIVKYLKNKGEDVSLFSHGFFVRGKIFRYLPLYRKLSIETTGKAGQLYITFSLPFSYFLLFSFLEFPWFPESGNNEVNPHSPHHSQPYIT